MKEGKERWSGGGGGGGGGEEGGGRVRVSSEENKGEVILIFRPTKQTLSSRNRKGKRWGGRENINKMEDWTNTGRTKSLPG